MNHFSKTGQCYVRIRTTHPFAIVKYASHNFLLCVMFVNMKELYAAIVLCIVLISATLATSNDSQVCTKCSAKQRIRDDVLRFGMAIQPAAIDLAIFVAQYPYVLVGILIS